MKIIGKLKEYITTDKQVILTFNIPLKYMQQMPKIPTDKDLTIVVEKLMDKRSDRQNKALWSLITEITRAENGMATKSMIIDLYKQLIVEAHIKVYYMKVESEAIPFLEKKWRAVEILRVDVIDGVSYTSANLYKGSSDFNTKEMTDLIEVVLDRGKQYNINLQYYEEQLK